MRKHIENSLFKDVEFKKVKEFENMETYNLTYEFHTFILPNKNQINNIFKNVKERDNLILSISMDELQPIYLKELSDYVNFINQIQKEYSQIYDDESKFILKIEVDKKIENNSVNFYSTKKFEEFLSNKTLYQHLNFFNDLIESYKFINFNVFDSNVRSDACWSNTICVTWNKIDADKPQININQKREDEIDKRNSICNPINSSNLVLTPTDFYLIKKSDNKIVNEVFEQLCFILSVTFICDITQVKENSLDYKLNGYKPIEGSIQFNKCTSNNELFKIYSWIYSDGNISDKVGLARNIISLNSNNQENVLDLTENVFGSIKSGYEIYLKENVRQYIEVKNKVSEFLIDKSLQSTNLVRNFTNSLKNNNFVFLSFFLSFIVFKTLSPYSARIFTKEIILLSYSVLLISTAYLIVSVLLINMDISRFNAQYNKIKSLYNGLLSPEDINSIFILEEHEKDISYIKNKRNLFAFIWGLELFILIVFVTVISSCLT